MAGPEPVAIGPPAPDNRYYLYGDNLKLYSPAYGIMAPFHRFTEGECLSQVEEAANATTPSV
jgi:hypothetical protein